MVYSIFKVRAIPLHTACAPARPTGPLSLLPLRSAGPAKRKGLDSISQAGLGVASTKQHIDTYNHVRLSYLRPVAGATRDHLVCHPGGSHLAMEPEEWGGPKRQKRRRHISLLPSFKLHVT